MKIIKFLFILLVTTHSYSQNQSYRILQYSDSINVNQPISIITSSFVDIGGPAPTYCSPIYSFFDTLINNTIKIRLTFDLSNRFHMGCTRIDTFYLQAPPQGHYNVEFAWYVIDTLGTNVPVLLDEDTIPLTVFNSTAISENSLKLFERKQSIFPNPVSNLFKIQVDNSLISVELYSLNGQLVKSYQKQEQYDVSDLPNGIYVVRGIAEDMEFHQKLIVAR